MAVGKGKVQENGIKGIFPQAFQGVPQESHMDPVKLNGGNSQEHLPEQFGVVRIVFHQEDFNGRFHLFYLMGRRFAQINAEKSLWLERILKICVHPRTNHSVFYCVVPYKLI
jgi:hypothetical protein